MLAIVALAGPLSNPMDMTVVRSDLATPRALASLATDPTTSRSNGSSIDVTLPCPGRELPSGWQPRCVIDDTGACRSHVRYGHDRCDIDVEVLAKDLQQSSEVPGPCALPIDAVHFNDPAARLSDPPGQSLAQGVSSLKSVLHATCRERHLKDGLAALQKVDERLDVKDWPAALEALDQWKEDYPPDGRFAIEDRAGRFSRLHRAREQRETSRLNRVEAAITQGDWRMAHQTLASLYGDGWLVSKPGNARALTFLDATASELVTDAWNGAKKAMEKRVRQEIVWGEGHLKKAKTKAVEKKALKLYRKADALAEEVRVWNEERVPAFTLGRVSAPTEVKSQLDDIKERAELGKASALDALQRRLMSRFRRKIKNDSSWPESAKRCPPKPKRVSWDPEIQNRLILDIMKCSSVQRFRFALYGGKFSWEGAR